MKVLETVRIVLGWCYGTVVARDYGDVIMKDLRFLGPETKDLIRAGYTPIESKGVIEVCVCGSIKIYDRDGDTYICHGCIDYMIGLNRSRQIMS